MDWNEELVKARQGNMSSIRRVLRHIADSLETNSLSETQRQYLHEGFNRLATDAENGNEPAAVRAAIRYFFGRRKRGRVKSPETDVRNRQIFEFVSARILGGSRASHAFVDAGELFHRSESRIARLYYRMRKENVSDAPVRNTDIL